ncbi:nucleoporin NUP42-like [Corticium candelabrum]|uniref:nucleoporin NUP42-like n=1 Tax=Corticium candelabrum TaxID=121492 RepID=UPI002E253A69|nr:nucleoporin NUP42-like [Corticium candelabrum]
MTICKFFLEGRCSFGDRCRNEHPRGGLQGRPNARDVCKFFQQGNCRYGDKCKFYHPDGRTQQRSGFYRSERHSDGGRYAALSDGHRYQQGNQITSGRNQYADYNRSTNYRQQPQHNQGDLRFQQNDGNAWRHQRDPNPLCRSDVRERAADQPTMAEIRNTIHCDMDEWGRSDIWQLSSYSVRGSDVCIGDFEEFSQEEIRWEAYQAKTIERVPEYKANLMRLLHANRTERNRIKTDRNLAAQVGGGCVPQGQWANRHQQGGGILSGQMERQQSILGVESQPQSSMAILSPIVGPGIFVNQQNQTQSQPGVSSVQQQQQQQQQQSTQPSNVQAQQQTSSDQVRLSGTKVSEEDLLQFKADKFILGKVPECPPPLELC